METETIETTTGKEGASAETIQAKGKTNGKESALSKFQKALVDLPEDNSALSAPEDRGTQTGKEESKKEAETDDPKGGKVEDKTIEAPKPDAPAKDAKLDLEKGPKEESRYSKEIREQKAKVKALEDENRRLKGEKPEPPKEFVPKPKPPTDTYTEAQLIGARPQWEQALRQAQVEGREDDANRLSSELRTINELLVDYKLYNVRLENWESRNKAEADRIKQQEAFYEEHLRTKLPDLFDPEKPLARVFEQIENDQTIQDYVAFAKGRPDGRLFLARLADLQFQASSTGALVKELQETKEKLAALEKKTQPIANSTGANRLEAPGESKEKAITRLRRGLREAGI